MATGANSRPISVMSADGFDFSASILASASPLDISVSVWVTPYLADSAFQISPQFAQSSGMPRLTTFPSLRAAACRSASDCADAPTAEPRIATAASAASEVLRNSMMVIPHVGLSPATRQSAIYTREYMTAWRTFHDETSDRRRRA